jgi:hypothetical protein
LKIKAEDEKDLHESKESAKGSVKSIPGSVKKPKHVREGEEATSYTKHIR